MNSERKFVILICAKNNRTYNLQKRVMNWAWIKKNDRIYHVYGNGLLGQGEKALANHPFLVFRSTDPTKNKNLYAINSDSANNLYCDSFEGWNELLPNTLSAIKYLRENEDFDYLIRTNQSTYWNLNNLKRLLNNLPLNKVYVGYLEKREHPNIDFISGSGIIFSKDVVDLLISNQNNIESEFLDDVSIGRFLNRLDIKPYHLDRPEVKIDLQKLNFTVKVESIQKRVKFWFGNEIPSAVSIRCKDTNHKFLRFRLDPIIIIFVHVRILLGKSFNRDSR
jgi:hypothetical protein